MTGTLPEARAFDRLVLKPGKGSRPLRRNGIYLAVAALIALTAFGIGQLFPGFGVPFVILASSAWVAWSVAHKRKLDAR